MTTLTSTPPAVGPYVSRFADGKHNGGLLRSLKSELIKLKLPSILITSIAAIIVYVGLATLLSNYATEGGVDLAFAVGGWTLFPVFVIVIGTLAVTTEYSTNTMRTTTLAEPKRTRGFTAKAIAVAILAVVVSTLTVCLSVLGLYATNSDVTASGDSFLALAMFVFVMTSYALIALGLGYALRSTAGTITALFALIYLIDLLALIDNDFFRETLPKFFPNQVATVIIDNPGAEAWYPILDGRPMAIIVMTVYVIAALALGMIAYKRRDV